VVKLGGVCKGAGERHLECPGFGFVGEGFVPG
jgi:hypothetical protein